MLSVATLLRWWKIWFVEDKFLKFYSCSHKQRAKQRICVSVGIAGLSHVRALAHSACKMVAFLDRETPDFMSTCCSVLTRQTFFISKPDWVHHWSRTATDSTSWDKQACTHDTLWRQHYVTTSKEHLINCHIWFKYFELLFFQQQLTKFCVKWSSFWWIMRKTKRGPFLWNIVYYKIQW